MTTTDQIVTQARARFEHAAARKLIQEKYHSRMLFAAQGGMWRAGPELQIMLSTCSDVTAVILDLYNTPVQVNTQELLAQSQQRWQEQMNAWLVEYEQLNQNR